MGISIGESSSDEPSGIQYKRMRCGVAIHVRNKANPEVHAVLGVLCRSWNCAVCRPYLERKWSTYLAGLFAPMAEVRIGTAPIQEWNTISHMMRKYKGLYVKIRMDAGTVAFMTTSKGYGKPVSGKEAAEFAQLCVKTTIWPRRPVHASYEWKMPPAEEPSEEPEWERLESVAVDVDDIRKVVEDAGFKTEPVSWGSYRGFKLSVRPTTRFRITELCRNVIESGEAALTLRHSYQVSERPGHHGYKVD